MRVALELLASFLGLGVAVPSAYLLTLAVASAWYRPRETGGSPYHTLVVLMPAHNEADSIAACVQSFLAQLYPPALRRVIVIADNCTDSTAASAAAAGAEVLIRVAPDAPGKGRALRWALDQVLAGSSPPQAIIIVDADSFPDPDLLAALEGELRAGNEIVQAEYLLRPDSTSRRSVVEAAALLLHHRIRLSGRAALGLPATLCGNGMLISARVLHRYPWDAFTSVEDGEYAMKLRLAGDKTVFAGNAKIWSDATASEWGAYTQALRWDGGRFYMLSRWLFPLLRTMVRTRRWDLALSALDMLTPPLTLLCLAAVLGTTAVAAFVALGWASAWATLPWVFAVLALPAYVTVGLWLAGGASGILTIASVLPSFVARKLRVYARLSRGLDVGRWVRTERAGENVTDGARR